jgi:hypothetical protein
MVGQASCGGLEMSFVRHEFTAAMETTPRGLPLPCEECGLSYAEHALQQGLVDVYEKGIKQGLTQAEIERVARWQEFKKIAAQIVGDDHEAKAELLVDTYIDLGVAIRRRMESPGTDLR